MLTPTERAFAFWRDAAHPGRDPASLTVSDFPAPFRVRKPVFSGFRAFLLRQMPVIMICGEAGEEMFGLARMPEALNGNTEGSPQGASDAGTQQSGRLCERRRALLPSGRNFPLDPTFSKVHLVFISVFLYNYISVKTDKASIMACVRRDTPCPAGLGELRHFSESYGREQNAEHQKDH